LIRSRTVEEEWAVWLRENMPVELQAEMKSSQEWGSQWPQDEIKRLEKRLAPYENVTHTERRFRNDYLKRLGEGNGDGEKIISEHAANETGKAKIFDLFNMLTNAASKTIREADNILMKFMQDHAEIDQMCGKALGYPWYKDDLKNFPSATEADGVCTGEHVAVSIVAELAHRYERLHRQVTLFKNNEDRCGEMSKAGKDKEHVLARLAILKDIYKEAGLEE
jgi:hypothetical protein